MSTPRAFSDSRGTTIVLLTATLAALAGLVLMSVLLTQPRLRSVAAGTPATVGNLSVSVERAAWVGHDMSGMPGMPMGAPGDLPAEGSARLHVQVLLTNDDTDTIDMAVEEMRLTAASGRSWAPQRTTLPTTATLPPGAAVVGDLYFEVPDEESGLHLRIDRGRRSALMTLPLPGASHGRPQHEGTDK